MVLVNIIFLKSWRDDELNNKVNRLSIGIGSPDLPPHPDDKNLAEGSAKPNVHAYQSYKGSPVLQGNERLV
jgi:hypothetical protein